MARLAEDFAANASFGRNDGAHTFAYGGFVGIAFFRPGDAAGFSVDRPCFLAVRRSANSTRLAVYEPSWTRCTLRIALPFTPSAPDLSAGCHLEGNTLVADLEAGRPFEVGLKHDTAAR